MSGPSPELSASNRCSAGGRRTSPYPAQDVRRVSVEAESASKSPPKVFGCEKTEQACDSATGRWLWKAKPKSAACAATSATIAGIAGHVRA